MSQIDPQKSVYLFVHGRRDLEPVATQALVTNGFAKDKIISAKPDQVGNVGDYMAMIWMPPNPDHIKIQKITKVDPVPAEGMVGLWKGVSKEDLFQIKLG
ncbi:MAG TPA: hypothetical protein VGR54_07065 [Nitrosopumilaceae archaeon]|nr:hypothetical protein [Nitrosopumilaceae archaeon]